MNNCLFPPTPAKGAWSNGRWLYLQAVSPVDVDNIVCTLQVKKCRQSDRDVAFVAPSCLQTVLVPFPICAGDAHSKSLGTVVLRLQDSFAGVLISKWPRGLLPFASWPLGSWLCTLQAASSELVFPLQTQETIVLYLFSSIHTALLVDWKWLGNCHWLPCWYLRDTYCVTSEELYPTHACYN